MLTDFAADQAFGIAWSGLMALVWFGWAQEDPPESWRRRLGVGSILGLLFAGGFGYSYFAVQDGPTALEGRYHWFGVLVLVEMVLAVIGVVYLWRTDRTRWQAWWVALVVAGHFVPMMFLLDDMAYLLLGLFEVAGLIALVPPLRASEMRTSRLVGPFMGATLVLFSLVSACMFLISVGTPW